MTSLTTTIAAVTVYPDRARVIRRGALALEPGLHRLEVSELPIQLNPDSLRTAARGTARARLLGAQVQRAYYSETPAEQVRQLEEQIEALQDDMRKLDIQAELVKQNRATLDKLASHTETYATAMAAGETTVEQQLALFDGLRARSEKLNNEMQALAVTRRTAERRLQKLTKELEQLRGSRPRERYTAAVEVEVLQAGELSVELTYVVTGAEWRPLYDLRLLEAGADDDKGGPMLEVSYLGQIAQTTGESWENVSLTLSTARPALTRTLPELDPWYIRPLPPPRMVAAKARAPGMMQSFAAAVPQPAPVPADEQMLSASLEEAEAEEVTAQVETSGAAVTYLIPGMVTVPPDGAPHKVLVARFPLPPRLDYVCAPKLAEAVYRRAKLINNSPYTLLKGDANLFIGEEFIGSTPLELTAPQAEVELFLGADDRIKVERELKRREVGKQFIGGKRHLAFGYEIRLENLLGSPARLTVHDQFPVARHEEIKVKLELAEPKPAEQSELNLLKWELTLEPKEKRTLRFDFSVENPQSMEVIGLP
jgi:uncharacterized protein (TIGR02231 family)